MWPLTLDDGYAIGEQVDAALVARGWRHAGRKLGFTDQAHWPRLALDEPVWAYLYDKTVRWYEGATAAFALVGAVAPRLEVEIVVGLRDAPSRSWAPGTGAAELVGSLAWFALGVEVIDCHYDGWRFSPADALADFLFHAGLLVGPRHAFASPDEAREWASLVDAATASVTRDGVAVADGHARNVLGSPIQALAALSGLLERRRGPALMAGEIVTTGTMTAPLPVSPGDDLVVSVTGLALEPLRIRLERG